MVLSTLLVFGILLTTVGSAGAASNAATTVPLGTAGNFAILAGTAITNVPTSSITGNVGLSPAAGSFIGLTCTEVSGTIYSVDATGPLPCRVTDPDLLTVAKNDLITAFDNAGAQTPDQTFAAGDNQLGLAGTLTPGVYRFGSATTANLIGNLTLSGGAGDVWVFQATSDLVTASASSITFSGGAQACNVFWQVNSSATLGSGSSFAGTIMALSSITVANGVNVAGRLLARNGNVTLIADSVASSSCAAAPTVGPELPTPEPPREIYCTPAGVAYDLVAGQNTLAPYNTLGLVVAYVDPVTGAKSCEFPTAAPAPAPVTPPVATPPPGPDAAAIAAAKAAAAKKLAAAKAAAAKKAAAASEVGFARKARVRVALTG